MTSTTPLTEVSRVAAPLTEEGTRFTVLVGDGDSAAFDGTEAGLEFEEVLEVVEGVFPFTAEGTEATEGPLATTDGTEATEGPLATTDGTEATEDDGPELETTDGAV